MPSRIVLITGCSSGIGQNLANHLSESGYTVVATARKPETLAPVKAALKLSLDVTDPDSIAQAVQETLARFGRIDVLVNNAGYAVRGAVEELDEALSRAMFDVNVWGLVRMSKAVLPHMRARGTGRIIHIGSVVGKFIFPISGAYAASKHAVEALSDAMRVELKPFGIPVVLIEPGTIRTRFMETSEALGATIQSNPDSPYAPLYREFQRMATSPMTAWAGPNQVSRVIQRAIEARRPKARYLAAVSPLYRIMMKAGDRLRDFMLQKAFRIPSAPIVNG